jgi:hypothetical protein
MRFALRVLAFAFPLLVAALVFETALFRTGESWPIGLVVRRQSETPESVYGREVLSQQFNLYKLANIRNRAPAILVVGSSRVMQFRGFLFHPREAGFYNAGGLIQTDADLIEYAREVRSGALPAPQALIVGIDPWWLKPGASPHQWITDGPKSDAALRFGEHVQAARSLLKTHEVPFWDAVAGRLERTPAYGFPGFGLAALAYGDGERHDGSHLYTIGILDFLRRRQFHDRETPTILQRVRESSRQFTPADSLDARRIDAFIAAFQSLRERGVEVETFLPPYSDAVLAALDEAAPGWWIDYRDRLPARLRAAGFVCLPVGSPASYDLDDRYMFDGFHPSEVFDSYLLERLVGLAKPGGVLSEVDVDHLRKLRSGPRVIPLAFSPPHEEWNPKYDRSEQ